MIKSLTPLILITFAIWKKKNSKWKGRLIQNPNYEIPSIPLHTPERTVLIERKALSHLLNPKWLGRGKVPFFEGTPGNRSSGDGVGPVAQRIRARGYEPRCRGFESLLAHNRPKREGPFPPGGRKIMLGIADSKLWNLVGDGSFVEIEWSGLLFYLNLDIYIYYIYRFFFTYSIFTGRISIFFEAP